jgi:hypothetical protein
VHLFLQQPIEGAPVDLWWLWLLVAGLFIGVIVYLVGRIGPGGPWMSR